MHPPSPLSPHQYHSRAVLTNQRSVFRQLTNSSSVFTFSGVVPGDAHYLCLFQHHIPHAETKCITYLTNQRFIYKPIRDEYNLTLSPVLCWQSDGVDTPPLSLTPHSHSLVSAAARHQPLIIARVSNHDSGAGTPAHPVHILIMT